MFKKNFIDINPIEDKERYIIYTDLKNNGKAIIDKTDNKNKWWEVISKQIGRETKDLVQGDKKFVIISSNYDHRIGVVTINQGVVVREEKIGEKSRFFVDLIK
jgi:hypothetical protein